MEYKPLGQTRNEIPILPIVPSPKFEHSSAEGFDTTEDLVHYTLEHVSPNEITDEYRAYQSRSQLKPTWE
jgi:hypothetical protein